MLEQRLLDDRFMVATRLVISLLCIGLMSCSDDTDSSGWRIGTDVSERDTDAGPTDANPTPGDVSDTRQDSPDGPPGDASRDGAADSADAVDTNSGAEQGEPCERTEDCRGELNCVNADGAGDQRQCDAPDAGCDCNGEQWCTTDGECVDGDYCDSSEDCHAASCRSGNYCGDLECDGGGECIGEEDCVLNRTTSTPRCEPNACRCKDPRDLCFAGTTCLRHVEDCALSGCPEGYACTQRGCECAGGPHACKRPCTELEQCGDGAGSVCSQNQYCEIQLCETDQDCPSGFACGNDPYVVLRSYRSTTFCVRAGSKAAGESCSSSTECSSGYCKYDLCLDACKQNSDCSDDTECVVPVESNFHYPAYCRSPVCGDCAADEWCNSQTGACQKFCLSTADCDVGETCQAGSFYPICQAGTQCERDTDEGTVTETCEPDELCVTADLSFNRGCAKSCLSDSECSERADCDRQCTQAEVNGTCRDYYCRSLDGITN